MANNVNPVRVQKYLKGLEYPTDKKHIVETARTNGADNDLLSFFERMPERSYGGPNGIAKELKGTSK